LDDLIERFIIRSKDHERSIESVHEQIKSLLDNETGALWLIKDGNRLCGYFFCEIAPAEVGGFVAVIHEVFVEGLSSSLLQEIDSVIEEWAVKKGARALAFFTRRNGESLLRSLNGRRRFRGEHPWEIDSIVLKRRI